MFQPVLSPSLCCMCSISLIPLLSLSRSGLLCESISSKTPTATWTRLLFVFTPSSTITPYLASPAWFRFWLRRVLLSAPPQTRGPGPLGRGGKRTKPGHDVIHLRGRFPVNALTDDRSSGIVIDDIQIHALSRIGSDAGFGTATEEEPEKGWSARGIRFEDDGYTGVPNRSASRMNVPNVNASSSEAHLFRPVAWGNNGRDW